MIKKTASALLFSILTMAGIGCWDFGYEESQYVSPFDENVLVAPDLMPFLFSALHFHWSFDSLTQGNLPTSEERWVQYFHQKYSLKDIAQLTNNWTEEEFQWGLRSKEDTFQNALLSDFRKGKYPLERQYLELAHRGTPLKQSDDWANYFSWWDISYEVETQEDAAADSSASPSNDTAAVPTETDGTENGINQIALEREKLKEKLAQKYQDSLTLARGTARFQLIQQLEKLRNKTRHPELLERINYQILVLNYYQPMAGNTEKIFQKTYPQPQPNSIFYWLAYDHYAGTPQRALQEDQPLDWIRIFLHAPSLRMGAVASFPEQDDDSWEGLLNCAKSPEEKVGLWMMLAYQQPEITSYAFEKAFQISERSPYTDLLLVREIQLLERQFHLQENRLATYPYTPAYTYEYQGLEIKQHIRELAFRWNHLFKKNPANLTETQHLGWAYLQHLAGNEEEAMRILKSFHPKNESILRSKRVFQILVRQQINYRDGWNDGQDAQTVKDLEWLSGFPGFERISEKKGWNLTDWERPDGKSDLPYDGRIFESNETYPYAAMRDGLRIYLYEYMRHRSEEEDAFATPSAPKSLAMWYLSPLFNVYDYPENWDAAGIVELLQHPENQSQTDQWFLKHLPETLQQTAYVHSGENWVDSNYFIPINSDFWNEIAGELALQKRDYSSAALHFNQIKQPQKFPRLKLSNNPLALFSLDVSAIAKTELQLPTISNKIELAKALFQLSANLEGGQKNAKNAVNNWILGVLEYNISYTGNSWEACRFAWSYNDLETFQSDSYWRNKNYPDEKYFDIGHPKQRVYEAYQYFQSNKKLKEFAAGCAISLLQMNIDGNHSYWSYIKNPEASQQSAMLIEWLQTKFSKTKTFRTFEKNCPEYEVYALTNWD